MPTRRMFLGVAAGLVGGAALGYGGLRVACTQVPRIVPPFFAQADLDALRQFGLAAIKKYPAYADIARVSAALDAKPLIVEAFESGCPQTTARLVADQCCDDFAAGEMKTVDGVLVSETETLLCALMVHEHDREDLAPQSV